MENKQVIKFYDIDQENNVIEFFVDKLYKDRKAHYAELFKYLSLNPKIKHSFQKHTRSQQLKFFRTKPLYFSIRDDYVYLQEGFLKPSGNVYPKISGAVNFLLRCFDSLDYLDIKKVIMFIFDDIARYIYRLSSENEKVLLCTIPNVLHDQCGVLMLVTPCEIRTEHISTDNKILLVIICYLVLYGKTFREHLLRKIKNVAPVEFDLTFEGSSIKQHQFLERHNSYFQISKNGVVQLYEYYSSYKCNYQGETFKGIPPRDFHSKVTQKLDSLQNSLTSCSASAAAPVNPIINSGSRRAATGKENNLNGVFNFFKKQRNEREKKEISKIHVRKRFNTAVQFLLNCFESLHHLEMTETICFVLKDVEAFLLGMNTSSRRETFSKVPSTTMDDLGFLLKKESIALNLDVVPKDDLLLLFVVYYLSLHGKSHFEEVVKDLRNRSPQVVSMILSCASFPAQLGYLRKYTQYFRMDNEGHLELPSTFVLHLSSSGESSDESSKSGSNTSSDSKDNSSSISAGCFVKDASLRMSGPPLTEVNSKSDYAIGGEIDNVSEIGITKQCSSSFTGCCVEDALLTMSGPPLTEKNSKCNYAIGGEMDNACEIGLSKQHSTSLSKSNDSCRSVVETISNANNDRSCIRGILKTDISSPKSKNGNVHFIDEEPKWCGENDLSKSAGFSCSEGDTDSKYAFVSSDTLSDKSNYGPQEVAEEDNIFEFKNSTISKGDTIHENGPKCNINNTSDLIHARQKKSPSPVSEVKYEKNYVSKRIISGTLYLLKFFKAKRKLRLFLRVILQVMSDVHMYFLSLSFADIKKVIKTTFAPCIKKNKLIISTLSAKYEYLLNQHEKELLYFCYSTNSCDKIHYKKLYESYFELNKYIPGLRASDSDMLLYFKKFTDFFVVNKDGNVRSCPLPNLELPSNFFPDIFESSSNVLTIPKDAVVDFNMPRNEIVDLNMPKDESSSLLEKDNNQHFDEEIIHQSMQPHDIWCKDNLLYKKLCTCVIFLLHASGPLNHTHLMKCVSHVLPDVGKFLNELSPEKQLEAFSSIPSARLRVDHYMQLTASYKLDTSNVSKFALRLLYIASYLALHGKTHSSKLLKELYQSVPEVAVDNFSGAKDSRWVRYFKNSSSLYFDFGSSSNLSLPSSFGRIDPSATDGASQAKDSLHSGGNPLVTKHKNVEKESKVSDDVVVAGSKQNGDTSIVSKESKKDFPNKESSGSKSGDAVDHVIVAVSKQKEGTSIVSKESKQDFPSNESSSLRSGVSDELVARIVQTLSLGVEKGKMQTYKAAETEDIVDVEVTKCCEAFSIEELINLSEEACKSKGTNNKALDKLDEQTIFSHTNTSSHDKESAAILTKGNDNLPDDSSQTNLCATNTSNFHEESILKASTVNISIPSNEETVVKPAKGNENSLVDYSIQPISSTIDISKPEIESVVKPRDNNTISLHTTFSNMNISNADNVQSAMKLKGSAENNSNLGISSTMNTSNPKNEESSLKPRDNNENVLLYGSNQTIPSTNISDSCNESAVISRGNSENSLLNDSHQTIASVINNSNTDSEESAVNRTISDESLLLEASIQALPSPLDASNSDNEESATQPRNNEKNLFRYCSNQTKPSNINTSNAGNESAVIPRVNKRDPLVNCSNQTISSIVDISNPDSKESALKPTKSGESLLDGSYQATFTPLDIWNSDNEGPAVQPKYDKKNSLLNVSIGSLSSIVNTLIPINEESAEQPPKSNGHSLLVNRTIPSNMNITNEESAVKPSENNKNSLLNDSNQAISSTMDFLTHNNEESSPEPRGNNENLLLDGSNQTFSFTMNISYTDNAEEAAKLVENKEISLLLDSKQANSSFMNISNRNNEESAIKRSSTDQTVLNTVTTLNPGKEVLKVTNKKLNMGSKMSTNTSGTLNLNVDNKNILSLTFESSESAQCLDCPNPKSTLSNYFWLKGSSPRSIERESACTSSTVEKQDKKLTLMERLTLSYKKKSATPEKQNDRKLNFNEDLTNPFVKKSTIESSFEKHQFAKISNWSDNLTKNNLPIQPYTTREISDKALNVIESLDISSKNNDLSAQENPIDQSGAIKESVNETGKAVIDTREDATKNLLVYQSPSKTFNASLLSKFRSLKFHKSPSKLADKSPGIDKDVSAEGNNNNNVTCASDTTNEEYDIVVPKRIDVPKKICIRVQKGMKFLLKYFDCVPDFRLVCVVLHVVYEAKYPFLLLSDDDQIKLVDKVLAAFKDSKEGSILVASNCSTDAFELSKEHEDLLVISFIISQSNRIHYNEVIKSLEPHQSTRASTYFRAKSNFFTINRAGYIKLKDFPPVEWKRDRLFSDAAVSSKDRDRSVTKNKSTDEKKENAVAPKENIVVKDFLNVKDIAGRTQSPMDCLSQKLVTFPRNALFSLTDKKNSDIAKKAFADMEATPPWKPTIEEEMKKTKDITDHTQRSLNCPINRVPAFTKNVYASLKNNAGEPTSTVKDIAVEKADNTSLGCLSDIVHNSIVYLMQYFEMRTNSLFFEVVFHALTSCALFFELPHSQQQEVIRMSLRRFQVDSRLRIRQLLSAPSLKTSKLSEEEKMLLCMSYLIRRYGKMRYQEVFKKYEECVGRKMHLSDSDQFRFFKERKYMFYVGSDWFAGLENVPFIQLDFNCTTKGNGFPTALNENIGLRPVSVIRRRVFLPFDEALLNADKLSLMPNVSKLDTKGCIDQLPEKCTKCQCDSLHKDNKYLEPALKFYNRIRESIAYLSRSFEVVSKEHIVRTLLHVLNDVRNCLVDESDFYKGTLKTLQSYFDTECSCSHQRTNGPVVELTNLNEEEKDLLVLICILIQSGPMHYLELFKKFEACGGDMKSMTPRDQYLYLEKKREYFSINDKGEVNFNVNHSLRVLNLDEFFYGAKLKRSFQFELLAAMSNNVATRDESRRRKFTSSGWIQQDVMYAIDKICGEILSRKKQDNIQIVESQSLDRSSTEIPSRKKQDNVESVESQSLDRSSTEIPSRKKQDNVERVESQSLDRSSTEIPSRKKHDNVERAESQSLGRSSTEIPSRKKQDNVESVESQSLDRSSTEIPSRKKQDNVERVESQSLGRSSTEIPSRKKQDNVESVESQSLDRLSTEIPSRKKQDNVERVESQSMDISSTEIPSRKKHDNVERAESQSLGRSSTFRMEIRERLVAKEIPIPNISKFHCKPKVIKHLSEVKQNNDVSISPFELNTHTNADTVLSQIDLLPKCESTNVLTSSDIHVSTARNFNNSEKVKGVCEKDLASLNPNKEVFCKWIQSDISSQTSAHTVSKAGSTFCKEGESYCDKLIESSLALPLDNIDKSEACAKVYNNQIVPLFNLLELQSNEESPSTSAETKFAADCNCTKDSIKELRAMNFFIAILCQSKTGLSVPGLAKKLLLASAEVQHYISCAYNGNILLFLRNHATFYISPTSGNVYWRR